MKWASQRKGDMHGRRERRETSKDFDATTFQTDNSASASPSARSRTHTHTHMQAHAHH